MKVLIPPYHKRIIDPDNPFGNDFFTRKEFSENLTTLFKKSEDSLVITLNAKWGEGKTTFIKLWEKSLKDDDQLIPIYYDAFKNDFTKDVFFSIAVTIQEAVNNYWIDLGKDPNKTKKLDLLKESAIDLGQELLKVGASSTANILSGGTVQPESFIDKIFDRWAKYKKRKDKSFLDEKFNSYLTLRDSIEKYQNELISTLDSDQPSKKVLFFVDELDRCRPDFAVEVIEKIKHLFNTKGVHFVLAINKEQLVRTFAKVYGVEESSASIYLQKFVHIETNLPTLADSGNNDSDYIKQFIIDTSGELGILKSTGESNKLVELSLMYLKSKNINLTPRALERVLSLIAISVNSCTKDELPDLIPHFILLSFYKINDFKVYNLIKEGSIYEARLDANEPLSKKVFKYLTTDFFYPGQYKKSASNMIKVFDLKEAAKIVDIYSFPEKLSNKFDGEEGIDKNQSLTHKKSQQ